MVVATKKQAHELLARLKDLRRVCKPPRRIGSTSGYRTFLHSNMEVNRGPFETTIIHIGRSVGFNVTLGWGHLYTPENRTGLTLGPTNRNRHCSYWRLLCSSFLTCFLIGETSNILPQK